MNAERRKELEKARTLIAEARDIIDSAQSDEQEYFDNMPENMQAGEKGTKAEETASALEEISGELDELLGRIEECEA